MILRAIINAEYCGPGNRWDLDLECGHTLEWVSVGRRFPKRKHCPWCEGISIFAANRPTDYSILTHLVQRIPPEDRPQALLAWIWHYTRAENMQNRIPGLDFAIALRLTEEDGRYPLPLDDEGWQTLC